MNRQKTAAGGALPEIRIMMFPFMDIRIGVDMEQIAEILDLAAARERRLDLHFFHETFFPDQDAGWRSPAALLLRGGDHLPAVVVETPQEIDAAVPLDAIHPMPALVTAACPRSPVWAAALPDDGRPVILVDLYRLLSTQRRHRK